MEKTEVQTLVLKAVVDVVGTSGQPRDAYTIKTEGIRLKGNEVLIEVGPGKHVLGQVGKKIFETLGELRDQYPNLEKFFVIVNK